MLIYDYNYDYNYYSYSSTMMYMIINYYMILIYLMMVDKSTHNIFMDYHVIVLFISICAWSNIVNYSYNILSISIRYDHRNNYETYVQIIDSIVSYIMIHTYLHLINILLVLYLIGFYLIVLNIVRLFIRHVSCSRSVMIILIVCDIFDRVMDLSIGVGCGCRRMCGLGLFNRVTWGCGDLSILGVVIWVIGFDGIVLVGFVMLEIGFLVMLLEQLYVRNTEY